MLSSFLIDHYLVFGFISISILLILLGMIFSPFFRSRRIVKAISADSDAEVNAVVPDVSVVMIVTDNDTDLESKLQQLLNQKYPYPVRIILVGDKGDNVLEFIRDKYKDNDKVYCTFLPTSSRYMSRKKLAITLGVKAVTTEWLVFIESHCSPNSDNWLNEMAKNFTEKNKFVIGYSRLEDSASDFYKFEHLFQTCIAYKDFVRNKSYRNLGMNLAMRKQVFLNELGFTDNLHLLYGEYDFLLNKAYGEGCTFELSEDSWMILDAPSKRTWRNHHIYYWETRKKLRHGIVRKFMYNTNQALLHLSYLLMFSALLWGSLTENWALVIAVPCVFLLQVTIRSYLMKRIVTAFKETIPTYKLAFYELAILWESYLSYLRYKRSDKYDFTCHKA